MDWQLEPFGGGNQHPAARRPVELGHDEAGDPCHLLKHLNLVQRILPGRRIEHQHHIMRGAEHQLLHHPLDLGQFIHQPGLVLQPTGGVDDEHVAPRCSRLVQRFKGQPSRIGTNFAGDYRRINPTTPDLQLFDGRRAERIPRCQHHPIVLLLKQVRQFCDGRGLARPVDPDNQYGVRAWKCCHLQRPRHGRQHPFDLISNNGAHLGLGDRHVIFFCRQLGGNPRCHCRAKVGPNQRLLNLQQHRIIKLGPGEHRCQPVTQFFGRAGQPGPQFGKPALGFRAAHAASAISLSPSIPISFARTTCPAVPSIRTIAKPGVCPPPPRSTSTSCTVPT